MNEQRGKLVIIAGPSGTGKTTIVRHLLGAFPRLAFSISACSRAIRTGEMDGEDYYFLTVEQFRERIRNDEFLEWEEVYLGSFYGTLRSEVERLRKAGRHVIFDIDVKGALNIKEQFGIEAIAIFIQPPSVADLVQRLRLRRTESEDFMNQRIEKAKYELSFAPKFDKVILNGNLTEAQAEAAITVSDFLK